MDKLTATQLKALTFIRAAMESTGSAPRRPPELALHSSQ